MKKESKEMLRTIISNQELMMKALKIEIPVKVIAKVESKKVDSVKKAPAKKIAIKKSPAKVVKK